MVFASERQNLQISQSLDRSEEEVAQLQARCHDFGAMLSPHSLRKTKEISQELECVCKWKTASLDLLPRWRRIGY